MVIVSCATMEPCFYFVISPICFIAGWHDG